MIPAIRSEEEEPEINVLSTTFGRGGAMGDSSKHYVLNVGAWD